MSVLFAFEKYSSLWLCDDIIGIELESLPCTFGKSYVFLSIHFFYQVLQFASVSASLAY